MNDVNPRVRQIYESHRCVHPDGTRQERWSNMLDKADIQGVADHRGLQIAFEQLEREYESISPV